jgi:hypothetical protein
MRSATILGAFLGLLIAGSAMAQTVTPKTASIFDPIRLGVGASAYREWNTDANFNTVASPDWRVALPLAWEITSVADPAVKHPISAIGSADYGFESKTWRFKAGIVFGLKLVGR